MRHTAAHCSTLQHTAAHCNTLQHTAAHCSTQHHTAPHCNTRQHTAAHCNTMQHTAAHCSTLQHTANIAKTPLFEGPTSGVLSARSSRVCSMCARSLQSGCNILQHIATHRWAHIIRTLFLCLQYCIVCKVTAKALQHAVTHCNTLLCAHHTHSLSLPSMFNSVRGHCNNTATQCSSMQHTTVRTSCALSFFAIHCNTLQQTLPHTL